MSTYTAVPSSPMYTPMQVPQYGSPVGLGYMGSIQSSPFCMASKIVPTVFLGLFVLKKIRGKDKSGKAKFKGPWGWLTLLSIPFGIMGQVGCGIGSALENIPNIHEDEDGNQTIVEDPAAVEGYWE